MADVQEQNFSELEPLYPEGNTNRTDPILRHDTQYESELIVIPYSPQFEGNENASGAPADTTKQIGITYPLIRINSHTLTEDMIDEFYLYNDKFAPYIYLSFRDKYNAIEFSDMPGLDNVVAITLLENDVKAHRPIKLSFYVTECQKIDDMFYINAEFKCLPLEQTQFKQEVFHYPDVGCNADNCKLPPNINPTTYEFLHVVAENCGLGFSASQKCRSIKDDRNRILTMQKYKDAIKYHTACGGLDENSIFDSWIDPWATLVMVNVPWIFNEDVKPNQLASLLTASLNSTDSDTDDEKQTLGMCHRMLTNRTPYAGMHNMFITEFKKYVDLSSGYENGTLTEYSTYDAAGSNTEGSNVLETQQIRRIENSKTGKKNINNYEFQNFEFSGVEMAMLTPTIKQKRLHDEYFAQQRTYKFKVKLSKPNFGLERGMLVSILWFEENPVNKATIVNRHDNLFEGGGEDPIDTPDNGGHDALDNAYVAPVDDAVSGLYYIDGIVWEYTNHEKIIQSLYLIKKGPITQYFDRSAFEQEDENK